MFELKMSDTVATIVVAITMLFIVVATIASDSYCCNHYDFVLIVVVTITSDSHY